MVVILSSYTLLSTLVRTIIYNIDDVISISEVYSYAMLGPERTCKIIERKYGLTNHEYVLLSNGTTGAHGAARALGWKIFDATEEGNLEKLYREPFREVSRYGEPNKEQTHTPT